MQQLRRFKLEQIGGYLWLGFLTVAFLLSAQNAYRKSLGAEEYPHACDAFGYLRMAKEIREAASKSVWPDFTIESEQTRLLINLLKSHNVPLREWEDLVAPHAHHYFPKADHVAVQYPPGTGMILALFPEGRAVYDLNRTIIWLFVITGLCALVIAGARRAWISAGLVVLALAVGFEMLVRLGTLSYSMNATFPMLMLSCLAALAALGLREGKPKLAWAFALLAGLLMGFATLIRLPSILLAPGFVLLLWTGSWRKAARGLPLTFCLALTISGVLPVLWYQQRVAGAWYLPTYNDTDATLPNPDMLSYNFSYYFGHEYASADNWALLYLIAGFIGFVLLIIARAGAPYGNRFGLSWKRLALASALVWTLPTIFFMTHKVTGLHYMMASTFGILVVAGFGALAVESSSRTKEDFHSLYRKPGVVALALALAILPGIIVIKRAIEFRATTPAPADAIAHKRVELPAELTDKHAWIWADLTTGTLWYYAKKPAFKVQFSNPETRLLVYRFVFERGDAQYALRDSEEMQKLMDEMARMGATFEQRGEVDGHPYFLIHWPQTGPQSATQVTKS